MTLLERQVQKLEKGKWKEYLEYEKKNEAVECRLGGFPLRKHYGVISGPDFTHWVVWQREWDSYGAMHDNYAKLGSDPKPELAGVISPVAGAWRFSILKDWRGKEKRAV